MANILEQFGIFVHLEYVVFLNISFEGNSGRGSVVVRKLDSRSSESGFESSCCGFENLAISFTTHCHRKYGCFGGKFWSLQQSGMVL